MTLPLLDLARGIAFCSGSHLRLYINLPGGCVEREIARPIHRASGPGCVEWGSRICISHMFLGAADVDVLEDPIVKD